MPPAARITDVTDHGPTLNTGPCSPDVDIGDQPAWRALPEDDWSGIETATGSMKEMHQMELLTPEMARPYLTDAEKGLKEAAELAAKHGEPAAAGVTASAFATLASKDAALTVIYRAEEPVDKMMAMKNYADGIHEASQIAAALAVEAIGKLSDQTVCPQVWIIVPHGPGVITKGSKTVFINDLPASREEDVLYEAIGGPDPVARGFQSVIIGDEGTHTELPQCERAARGLLTAAQAALPADLPEPKPAPLPDAASLEVALQRPGHGAWSFLTGVGKGVWKEIPNALLVLGAILLLYTMAIILVPASVIAAIKGSVILAVVMVVLLLIYVGAVVYRLFSAPDWEARGEVLGTELTYFVLFGFLRPVARWISQLRFVRRMQQARWVQSFRTWLQSIYAARGLIRGSSATESAIIREARSIVGAAEFAQVRTAHTAGQSVTVRIGGRLIQYEPRLPTSGMSYFGENGFYLGREAFASEAELVV